MTSSVADLIENQSVSIVEDWIDTLQQTSEPAIGVSRIFLRDEIPTFVVALAQHLRAPNGPAARESLKKNARGHGNQRAHSGRYSVSAMVREYTILREVILGRAAKNKVSFSSDELSNLSCAFEDAIGTAAEEFSAFTTEHGKGHVSYRSLVESVPQFVWAAEVDGELTYFNETWFRFSGSTYEQNRAHGWTTFVHPEDLPSAMARWKTSLETGNPLETEIRMRAASGAYRWFFVRAVPTRDETGAISKWYGTNTDIDDRRRLADQLAEIKKKYRR